MDMAKDIADGMLRVINATDDSVAGSALSGVITGAINVPVDLFYVGYEYLDAEHRSRNSNDTIRLMNLMKNGLLTVSSLEKIVTMVIKHYLGSLTHQQIERIMIKKGGGIVGGIVSNAVVVAPVVSLFVSRLFSRLAIGFSSTSLISLGASRTRAIYSSYDLLEKNSELYWEMRSAGDLDLLYFIVEHKMEPFIKAIDMQRKNREVADVVFNHLLDGLS